MKEITIQNEYVCATISEKAAEVISFYRKDNQIETIWCRNPEGWRNCNPILFPYTGPLKNGEYTYDGVTYKVGQHGFARDAIFTFESCTEDSATLSLSASEETKKYYPFDFKLFVTYRLDGCKLLLSYCVENKDERALPFDIGFHPAFNCPLTPDKAYSDYCIHFEKEEKLACERGDGVIIPDGDSFPLDKYLVKGSFFYHDNQIRSNYAELTDGEHTIRVGKEHFKTIGFWTPKEHAGLMCIEPWEPENDLEKVNFFRDDAKVNLLPPKEEFRCSYYIELVK